MMKNLLTGMSEVQADLVRVSFSYGAGKYVTSSTAWEY